MESTVEFYSAQNSLYIISLIAFLILVVDSWSRTQRRLFKAEKEIKNLRDDLSHIDLNEEIIILRQQLDEQKETNVLFEEQLKQRQKIFFQKISSHAKTLTVTLQNTEMEMKKLQFELNKKQIELKERDDTITKLKKSLEEAEGKSKGDEENQLNSLKDIFSEKMETTNKQ